MSARDYIDFQRIPVPCKVPVYLTSLPGFIGTRQTEGRLYRRPVVTETSEITPFPRVPSETPTRPMVSHTCKPTWDCLLNPKEPSFTVLPVDPDSRDTPVVFLPLTPTDPSLPCPLSHSEDRDPRVYFWTPTDHRPLCVVDTVELETLHSHVRRRLLPTPKPLHRCPLPVT